MPSLNAPKLVLTLSGSNVTIKVAYTAVFTKFEHFLGANGLVFREEIRVNGEDSSPFGRRVILHVFPIENVPASEKLTAARKRSITVSRDSLRVHQSSVMMRSLAR